MIDRITVDGKEIIMSLEKWIAHESIKEKNSMNLLCFIYDGGSASYFAAWKYKLAEDINLIPILYPVREKRRNEKMHENVRLFIEDLVISLESIFKSQYAFFGYCSGAVLAYEAVALAKKIYGVEPVYGMIVSSEAPKYLSNTVPKCTNENKEKVFLEHVSGLPTITEEMIKDKLFFEYYAPLITADYDLLRTYNYNKHDKLNCDFDIIMSPIDIKVEKNRVKEWGDLTAGVTQLFEKEGGHFLVEQQERFIFDRLNRRLSKKNNILTEEEEKEKCEEVHSDLEESIITIWKEILKNENINLYDNFFLKGGNSIKAAQIANIIRKELGIDINISNILKNPEVYMLAKYIEQQKKSSEIDEGEI